MHCIAIDFETANSSRSSACAVGVVVIRDGEIVDTRYSLIKPHEDHSQFHPYNVAIHGIKPEDVTDEPEFPAIWSDLHPLLTSGIVVAHNASFDMSVLRHSLDLYNLRFPNLDYTCSCIIAREAWPTLLSYSLPIVAKHLEIELEHHQALSDAKACGLIACRACKDAGAGSLEDLAKELGISNGRILDYGSYWPASGFRRSSGSSKSIDVSEIVPTSKAFDEDHPFYGKVFAFTGTLQCMVRREAMQGVVDHGGEVGNGVTKKTDFLVLGQADFRTFAAGQDKSAKLRKAEGMKAKGHQIEIMSEEDFYELIDTEPLPPTETPQSDDHQSEAEIMESQVLGTPQRIFRSIDEPIRENPDWDERWTGPDKGLITCWEVGRKLRKKDPDLARRAENGELPARLAADGARKGWKGGVEKKLMSEEKYGTLNYLAEWQGLRGEDLSIDLSEEVELVCSKTGMKVIYTADAEKYAPA